MELVNQSEWERKRAWREAQRGNFERYWRRVNLALELHTGRTFGPETFHVRDGVPVE